MFGNHGIFGEDVNAGNAGMARIDADIANSRARKSNRNAAELAESVDILLKIILVIIPGIYATRSVLREALVELKAADQDSPLLVKAMRDKIFSETYVTQAKAIAGQSFSYLHDNSQKFRDEAYGAENSTLGGPEFDKITPNVMVRAAIKYPSKTPS